MRQGERGVSLVEVMVVVAVLALGAALAGAKLHTNQVRNNERAAIRTLRLIAEAQARFQDAVAIDLNENGLGEFGFFGDLSGRCVLRGETQQLVPPVLPSAFGNVNAYSSIVRAGYLFRMYLPNAVASGLHEIPTTGGDPANVLGVYPEQAEELWCCYAWPIVYGTTGNRTFFVNQDGDVVGTKADIQQYQGSLVVPQQNAAFLCSSTGSMADGVAVNSLGMDANRWLLVH
jgi:prepilin-type N-terminal cleavage/methylation domain-containing protein